MKRREFLERTAALGILAALPSSAIAAVSAGKREEAYPPLVPPKTGPIPVAFLISDGAVVIDFCGPWEVFQDTAVPGRESDAFSLYTVAETAKPIRTSAGMKIVPEHTFADAPAPKVILIPAQGGHTPGAIDWIRKSAKTADRHE